MSRETALAKSAPAPLLDKELRKLLYWMRLTRALDDRILDLFAVGKIPGSVLSQLGHEAISVGATFALGPMDVIAPMHRDLGALLVRGMAPGRVIAQVMGRVGGPSGGRDPNIHGIGDLSLGIIGNVSHLPQSMPVALGAAFTFQYRGEDRVALTFAGDGASSEGGFHETLNLAAVLKAPVIIVIENNQYAYSTPLKHQSTITDLADRAAGYGIPGFVVDGNDVSAVYSATTEAAASARRGKGPTIIECKTMRMRGHTVHDPADYVPKALLEEWGAKDPIGRFERYLRDMGILDDAIASEIKSRVAREISTGIAWAEASAWPEGDSVTQGLFADA